MHQTSDINVLENKVLPKPGELLRDIPRTNSQSQLILQARKEIHRIIFGDDTRLLLVVGPCSIHDTKAGLEYGQKLSDLAKDVSDQILLVMRVYFEKPRTSIGWKGLIMDPHLNNSADIEAGLQKARNFLRDIIDLGLPTATELLDPITPQYIADLICWSAIGARTTESQTHRQMASGLSMPLGFKNGTDGNLDTAINAIRAASSPQTFLGINQDGQASAVTTQGNPNCHMVLRGGTHGPNYSAADIQKVENSLKEAKLTPSIMVDCSHENSGKKPEQQPAVFNEILSQITSGNTSIIGAMLESNLNGGNQSLPASLDELQYGVSITDGCINWESTEKLIRAAHSSLASRFTS